LFVVINFVEPVLTNVVDLHIFTAISERYTKRPLCLQQQRN